MIFVFTTIKQGLEESRASLGLLNKLYIGILEIRLKLLGSESLPVCNHSLLFCYSYIYSHTNYISS